MIEIMASTKTVCTAEWTGSKAAHFGNVVVEAVLKKSYLRL
jgi:hypothetical protein